MLKKILIGLALVVVIPCAGVVLVGANLETIAKSAIQKFGSDVLGTNVQLDKIKLSLLDGKVSLSGLSIGNPTGFTAPKAFSLGTVNLQIEPKSVLGDGPVLVKEITIDKPQITYEISANGETNIKVITQNTKKHSLPQQAEALGTPAPQEQNAKPERKIIISSLNITGGMVSATHDLMQGKSLNVPLPDLHLSDIGKANGGVTAPQLATFLMDMVGNSAAQSATTGLTKEIGNAAKDQVEKIGNQIKGFFGK